MSKLFDVIGEQLLLRKLDGLQKKVKNKVAKKAITAGVKEMAKAIKAEIPSTQKTARKAIGYSFKKPRSGKFKDMVFAKAGWGAGQSKKKREKKKAKAAAAGPRKRKGIGGEAAAVMLILGTADRYTGTKRVGKHRGGGASKTQRRVDTGGRKRFTGRVSGNAAVRDAASKADSRVTKLIITEIRAGIQREAGK